MHEIKKVLVVTNIPNPYRIPLFNELNKKLSEMNVQLKIAFGASTYSRRKFQLNPYDFKFDYAILPSKTFHFGNNEKTFFTYNGILNLVSEFQPDSIIIAGFSIGTFKLWVRSFFKKTHYIIWSGSILKKGRNDSFLRKIQRRFLLKKAAGFVAYGTKAKDYLVTLGAPVEKISIGINTVDTSYFATETKKFRLQISGDGKKHIMYLGYLVPRKNVLMLLQLIKKLVETRNDVIFDIIGEGEQRNELEKFVLENALEPYVFFHGFKQKKELPFYFAQCSCFLFQTDFDIWGLVLNEAMAAGVPCIASVNAGAAYDLVKDGETGYVADFNDHLKVIKKINELLDNPEKANLIGEKASDFIEQRATISISAKGFIYAIMNF